MLVGALLLAACSSGDDSEDAESLNRDAARDAVEDDIANTSQDERAEAYVANTRTILDSDEATGLASPEAIAIMKAMSDEEMVAEGERFCDEAAQFQDAPDELGLWLDELWANPGVFGMDATGADVYINLGGGAALVLCPEMSETFREMAEDLGVE